VVGAGPSFGLTATTIIPIIPRNSPHKKPPVIPLLLEIDSQITPQIIPVIKATIKYVIVCSLSISITSKYHLLIVL
jgi:hypothetical protein